MIVLSPTYAASKKTVVGLAQRVVVVRARAPRNAAESFNDWGGRGCRKMCPCFGRDGT